MLGYPYFRLRPVRQLSLLHGAPAKGRLNQPYPARRHPRRRPLGHRCYRCFQATRSCSLAPTRANQYPGAIPARSAWGARSRGGGVGGGGRSSSGAGGAEGHRLRRLLALEVVLWREEGATEKSDTQKSKKLSIRFCENYSPGKREVSYGSSHSESESESMRTRMTTRMTTIVQGQRQQQPDTRLAMSALSGTARPSNHVVGWSQPERRAKIGIPERHPGT